MSFGYDTFNDIRIADNHQSGSDFRIVTPTTSSTRRQRLSGLAHRTRRTARCTYIQCNPILESGQGTDFNTNSFFVNDRWRLNDNWSFNVGVRYDENDGKDAGGRRSPTTARSARACRPSYDLKGDGDLVFNASYGHYVAAIANNLADGTSNGGALGRAILFYRGAPINPNGAACLATNTCISTDQATHMAIDWWLGVTGFNPITDPPEDIAADPGRRRRLDHLPFDPDQPHHHRHHRLAARR